jgi:hypothetical protein
MAEDFREFASAWEGYRQAVSQRNMEIVRRAF